MSTHRLAVERDRANHLDRNQRFGYEFGAVEQIKVELVLVLSRNDLHAEIVLREGAGVDGVGEIATMEVWVLTSELERLVPDERVDAELGADVELDERPVVLRLDQKEGVDTEAGKMAIRARDSAIGLSTSERANARRTRFHIAWCSD